MRHAGSVGLGWGLWVILQTSLTHRTLRCLLLVSQLSERERCLLLERNEPRSEG